MTTMPTRAAIDIGTNSMRLLIVDEAGSEIVRRSIVTGLGRGVDGTGRLSEAAIERTVSALAVFGASLEQVEAVRAVATSATRDATNREDFLDRAEAVLGIRPEVISGTEEAALAHAGATAGLAEPLVVVDIGGGSTEFVRAGEHGGVDAISIDMGSVRLTDRFLGKRPVPYETLESAVAAAAAALQPAPDVEADTTLVGVAGTWCSLASMQLGGGSVHRTRLDRVTVDRWVGRLAELSLEETAALDGLDPARAPVILGGAIVARESMRRLGVNQVLVSEHDLLDGVVERLGS